MHHSERAKEEAWVKSGLLGNLSKGLHGGADGAPVCRLAVIAFLQQVLATLVVGMLVEDPPAPQDPGGMDLPPVELVQNGSAVVRCFDHLTRKVPFVIELDLVGLLCDLREGGGKQKWNGETIKKRTCRVANNIKESLVCLIRIRETMETTVFECSKVTLCESLHNMRCRKVSEQLAKLLKK